MSVTKVRWAVLRRAFRDMTKKHISVNKFEPEWLEAIRDECVRSSSNEIAWTISTALEEGKIVKTVMERLARAYRKTKETFYKESDRQFDTKVVSILNEVVHLLCDEEGGAKIALDTVATFMNMIHGTDLPASNCVLYVMSFAMIPPENNGYKRLNTTSRKTHHHALIDAAILSGSMEFTDANQSFLRSPSLKILFITQFKSIQEQGVLDVEFAHSIRTMIGISDEPLLHGELDSDDVLNDLFGNCLDDVLGATSPETVEPVANDGKGAEPRVATPPQKKKKRATPKRAASESWGGRERGATFSVFEHDPPEPAKKLVKLTDAPFSRGLVSDYFKVVRGVAVVAPAPYDWLLCDEPPIGAD